MFWKTIPGFSAYQISEYGHVRRHKKKVVRKVGRRKKPGQKLKPFGKYGTYALLNDEGNIIHELRTNRLMLQTFVGSPPTDKHVAAHWDDNTDNNHISNLRWATPKENGADAVRNGKTSKGMKNGEAKLTDKQVLKMRKLYKNKEMTVKEISKLCGLTLAPTHKMLIGESWSHLPKAVKPRGQGIKPLDRAARGSSNGNSKLKENQVVEIKKLLGNHTQVHIAKMFDVTKHTISAIKRGTVWKHI